MPRFSVTVSKTIQEAQYEPYKAEVTIEFDEQAIPTGIRTALQRADEAVNDAIASRLAQLEPDGGYGQPAPDLRHQGDVGPSGATADADEGMASFMRPRS